MSEMINMLQGAVAGRSPIVYVFSPEEERILRGIREIAATTNTPVTTWSCVRGLDGEDPAITQDPVEDALYKGFCGAVHRILEDHLR